MEICKKLGFKRVYQCDVLSEKVNIEKHMKIIMNPPYNRCLHLKILSHLINEYPEVEVVNLSPDDWIINPLIKYTTKKCELSFRKKLLPHLADLEHISLDDFNKLFGTSSFFGVGIQYYTKEGGYDYNKFINNDALTNKIWNAVTKMPSLRSKFEPLKDNDLFVPIRRRTHHAYKWTEDKINATEGIQFETKEEKENFVASLNTWIYKYLNKFPEGENSARVPYLGDYTHAWTNEMLYEYFHLNEEEIVEIEKRI